MSCYLVNRQLLYLAIFTFIATLLVTSLHAAEKKKYSPATRSQELPHYLADYHYQTAPLVPVDLTEYFVTPGEMTTIRFKMNDLYDWTETTSLGYRLMDYRGREISTGTAPVCNGIMQINLIFPQGFFELEITELEERFGVCALPAYQGERDPFFGIGIYFTFYMRQQYREPLIKNLRRIGISTVRDISKWNDLNPSKGVWQPEAKIPPGRFAKVHEELRQTLKENGIGMLEFAPGSPAWLKNAPQSEFPANLIEATVAWREWASRWNAYWDCFQVWNEPNHDGHKGNVAEFSAVVKAFAWAGQQERIKITNGGFSFLDRNYIRQCQRNGVMDSVSFVSLHVYDNSNSAPGIISGLREIVPNRQIWITESSSGFFRENIYAKRPKAENPASMVYNNCLDNAILAVECRADGVARYFPFSMITWPTDIIQMRNRRFYGNGCIDYHYTPLHNMAVYAQIIRALSGKKLIGEITWDNNVKAKIFTGNARAVIVLIGKPGQSLAPQNLPDGAYDAEGIDGRKLCFDQNGYGLEDGIAYLDLSQADMERKYGKQIIPAPKFPATETINQSLSSIILQPVFSAAESYSVNKSYLKLNQNSDRNYKLKVKINNLSDREKTVNLTVRADPALSVRHHLPQTLAIPPQSFVETVLDGELTDQVIATGEYHVSFSGIDSDKCKILPVDFALRIVSDDLLFFRKNSANVIDLAPANLKQWKTNNIFKGGKMQLSLNEENQAVINASFPDFKGYRTWATPTISFTEFSKQFTPESIIVLRGKLLKHHCLIKLTLWEADGARYETALPINDIDREGWQVMPVYVSDFIKANGELDENQKLDTDKIVKFGIIIACPHLQEMPDNQLTISDMLIISPQTTPTNNSDKQQ